MFYFVNKDRKYLNIYFKSIFKLNILNYNLKLN